MGPSRWMLSESTRSRTLCTTTARTCVKAIRSVPDSCIRKLTDALNAGCTKAPYGPGYKKCGEMLSIFGEDESSTYYKAGKRMLNECNLAVCEMRNNLDFTIAPEDEVAEFNRLETVNSALRIALESLLN